MKQFEQYMIITLYLMYVLNIYISQSTENYMQQHFQHSTAELQEQLYSVYIKYPKVIMTRKPHLKPPPC